jgi:hypothetical protein
MRSKERAFTAPTDDSWQEEAARLLLRSGFRPSDTIGQVEHITNTHQVGRTGRTFGSVWRAMRCLVESEPEYSGSKAPDVVRGEPLSRWGAVCGGSKAELGRASPAEAKRLLFGAFAIAPEDRTEIRNRWHLRIPAEHQ